MGSGTTNIVCQRMNRNSIGIEVVPEYYQIVKNQLEPIKHLLLETEEKYETSRKKRRAAVR